MTPKIVTIANGMNGGVYSIAGEWEWECLLTKLEAHCLEHVHTKKRHLSFASLPENGIFMTVACPVEYLSVPMEATEDCGGTTSSLSQLTPPSPNSTLWVEEDDEDNLERNNGRRAKELTCIDLPSDFYRNFYANQEVQEDMPRGGDLWKGHLGNDNHDEIAQICSQLAQDYLVHGNTTEAMKLYRKALSIRLTFLGKTHPSVSKTYNKIGTVYWMQGDHEEARRMHQLALTTRLDAIEEQYSEAWWGEANSNGILGTSPSRKLFDTIANVEMVEKSDSLDSGTQSCNSPSLASEQTPANEENPRINTTTSAPAGGQPTLNLASNVYHENYNVQHPAFPYLDQ